MMRVNELQPEQILPGMWIRNPDGCLGVVEEIDYLDNRYAWVRWEFECEAYEGFHNNESDAEVVSDHGAANLADVWAAGCLLFNEQDDEILVINRGDGGGFAVPGGKLELGETPVQGAVREVFEETGVKLDPEKIHLALVRSANGKDRAFAAFLGVIPKATPLVMSHEGAVRWGPERLLRLGGGKFREYNSRLLDLIKKPRDLQGWL